MPLLSHSKERQVPVRLVNTEKGGVAELCTRRLRTPHQTTSLGVNNSRKTCSRLDSRKSNEGRGAERIMQRLVW